MPTYYVEYAQTVVQTVRVDVTDEQLAEWREADHDGWEDYDYVIANVDYYDDDAVESVEYNVTYREVLAVTRGEDEIANPCTECGEDEIDEHGMCASCLHDAYRSGWEPGQD